ncbi:MAG: HAMP domain-containing protein [Candidatus Rokubacteria bacterium]|nr:HAMP domain-containing protein [Candidatus Rokubacteria bacterium]
MGLRLRLILVIMIPLVLVVGVYGVIRLRAEQAQLLVQNQRLMGLTAKAIQITVENALRDRQIGDIRRLLAEIVEGQEQIDRIRLFNHALEATLVSNSLTIGEQIPEDALRRVLAYGVAESFYQRRGAELVLYYVMPVRGVRDDVQAVMEIVHLAAAVEERAQAAVWDVAVRLGLVTVSVALLAGLMLQRQVLRPLAKLVDGIRRLGSGDTGLRLPIERPDELGRVAAAFNTMAAQLEVARRKLLEETERALDLERQLRHAQTLAVAGRLASALAHEVGTPLNIISGRAEFLQQSLAADDRHRYDLEIIIGQIDRISGIIRSLLDTVRPAKPEIQRVDVAGVVDRLYPLVRHAARRDGVTLEADLPAALPAVSADPNQLQQVLINLLMNALDAVEPGGHVRVAAAPSRQGERDGVSLTVVDSGPGIPPEVRTRMFEPFFTTKSPGRGTGLGLTICRDIVKEHGGEIQVDSAPAHGTRISVWLPAADGAVA